MTSSRDPEKPSAGGGSRARKRSRTPLSRRFRHLAQDTGYALKKAGRRATDPLRDSRPKPAAPKRRSRPEKPPRPAKPRVKREGREKPRRREKARRAKPRRARSRREQPRRERRRRRKPAAARAAAAVTRFGERSSKLILGVLAPVAAALLGVLALGRRWLARLASALTPLRAALAATALAAILLGVSQFVDYRGVAVGVSDYAAYADADVVAPAPEVDRQTAGSAHAYLLVPVALIALALLFAAARGRWQLGRVVSLLGLLAIATALIVDVPAGLDESAQAIAYAGVEAHLIEGFWVQLFAAAVLVFGGLLVSRYARRSRRRAPRPRRRAAAVGPARASAA